MPAAAQPSAVPPNQMSAAGSSRLGSSVDCSANSTRQVAPASRSPWSAHRPVARSAESARPPSPWSAESPALGWCWIRLDQPEAGPHRTRRLLRRVLPGPQREGELRGLRDLGAGHGELAVRASESGGPSVGQRSRRVRGHAARTPARRPAGHGPQRRSAGRARSATSGADGSPVRAGRPAQRRQRQGQLSRAQRIGAGQHRPPPGNVAPAFGVAGVVGAAARPLRTRPRRAAPGRARSGQPPAKRAQPGTGRCQSARRARIERRAALIAVSSASAAAGSKADRRDLPRVQRDPTRPRGARDSRRHVPVPGLNVVRSRIGRLGRAGRGRGSRLGDGSRASSAVRRQWLAARGAGRSRSPCEQGRLACSPNSARASASRPAAAAKGCCRAAPGDSAWRGCERSPSLAGVLGPQVQPAIGPDSVDRQHDTAPRNCRDYLSGT